MRRVVRIEYNRPPDRIEWYEQELLYQRADVVVTYLAETPLARPLVIADIVMLEPAAPAIWFSFPGRMSDIGRFHTAQGEFTGLYANVITPLEMRAPDEWGVTDLFLDVWVGVGKEPVLLDVEELERAVADGWVSSETAARAHAEAARIMAGWRAGTWPPAIVNEWPIERVSSERTRKR